LVAIVVIGLKTVGLVLIIAIVILPPVAARFWTERFGPMLLVAACIGALGCYLGAALSATAPRLPTGGVIVLTLAVLFVLSLLLAPARGLLAAMLRQLRFRVIVAERQALLAIAVGQPVLERLGRLVLLRKGLLTATGAPTTDGLSAARRVQRDQALWDRYLRDYPADAYALANWSLVPIEKALPGDLVAELDRELRGGAFAS
jgi:manganese/zinc/iron transport system permease protein